MAAVRALRRLSREDSVVQFHALTRGLAPKDLLDLGRGHHFELCVGAVARRLVDAETSELSGMSKATALHVIVGDLDHELGAQRFPRQILALAPAAEPSWHALLGTAFLGGRAAVLAPAPPRVFGERVLAI